MKNLLIILVAIVGSSTAAALGRRGAPFGPSIGSSFDSSFAPSPRLREQRQPFGEHSFARQPYGSGGKGREFQRQVQQSFRDQLQFGEQSPFRDHPALVKGRSSFGDQNYQGQTATAFKGDASPYRNELSLEQRAFRDDVILLEDQLRSKAQATERARQSQRELLLRKETGRFSDSMRSYKEGLSDKPMDSYGKQEQSRQPLSFGGHSNYLKYGNHGLGFASVPALSHESLPLEADTPGSGGNATLTVSTAARKPVVSESASTTTATVIGAGEPTSGGETRIESALTGGDSSTTMMPLPPPPTPPPLPPVETNARSDARSNGSRMMAMFTVPPSSSSPPPPSMSIPRKQSVDGGMKLATLTPFSQLDLTVQTLRPSFDDTSSNDDDTRLDHEEFFRTTATSFHDPDGFKANIQDAVINYLVAEEQKPSSSSSNSGTSVSFQHWRPETINYVPLAISGRQNPNVPSIPIAALSAISQAEQPVNYLSAAMVPSVAFVAASDSAAASPSLTLGTAIPASLSADVPTGVSTTVHTMLPSYLREGITTGIPSGITTSITAGIPTLNFGQSFQHKGQIQQFNDGRNTAFSPDLQLQLGGFGGINYVMPPNDLSPRPVELGLPKVGLNLPEISREHVPTFAKIGFGQHLW